MATVGVKGLIYHAIWYQNDLSGSRNLDRTEHALLLPSFWYEIFVPVTWTENFGRVS